MPFSFRRISLYFMAGAYACAGLNHFIHPEGYKNIMPPYLPAPDLLIAVSGALEIVGALLIIFPRTRRLGGWFLIALLLAVFPANIQMAVNYWQQGHPLLWIALLRLPLQGLLIYWAWKLTRKRRVKTPAYTAP
jgi:uncharacterized membrane protein